MYDYYRSFYDDFDLGLSSNYIQNEGKNQFTFQIVDLGVDTPEIEDSDVDSSDDEAENNHLLNPFEGVIERQQESPEAINLDSIFLSCLSNKQILYILKIFTMCSMITFP